MSFDSTGFRLADPDIGSFSAPTNSYETFTGTAFKMPDSNIPSFSSTPNVNTDNLFVTPMDSPALPGNQMSDLERGAMIGSLIGEGLHGVGNVVRAFKGQAPVRYAGKTVSDMFAKKRADAKRDELIKMFLGEEKTPGEEAQQSAEIAGSEVATASDPEPEPAKIELEPGQVKGMSDEMIEEAIKRKANRPRTGISFVQPSV